MLLLALAGCLAGAACGQQSPLPATDDGFLCLADSPDLLGWRPGSASRFRWQEGVLTRAGGGSILTDQLYESFTLQLEYRIARDGNSGVFLRAPLLGRQSALGMELQIMGDSGRPPDTGTSGAIYDAAAPLVNAARPEGEWNELQVDLHGRALRAVLNGQVIHDFSLDDPAVNAPLPAGLKLAERNHRGFIGLQDHGSEVSFRNIRLRPDPEEGFVSLLDAPLSLWTTETPAQFATADGILQAAAPADGPAALVGKQAYEDYVLRLEYRVEAGARAVLQTRTSNRPNQAFVEVVMADDSDLGLTADVVGALAGTAPPVAEASRPVGEWNDLEAICRGRLVTVYLNGVHLLSTNTNYWGKFMYAPLEGPPAIVVSKGTVELREMRVRALGRQ